MIKCLECGLCWIPLGGPGDQQIPDCPVCTLRERLVAAEARAEQKQDELNALADKWLAAEMERDTSRGRLTAAMGRILSLNAGNSDSLSESVAHGCRPPREGGCSMRPLPEPRSTCAGCGAPFVAPLPKKEPPR